MSIVWGAKVTIRFGPTFDASWWSAEPMLVGSSPFSRSMSTPSNPYF
ncbi:MAG TPA: hypothetical protein VGI39_30580 [Polyangiaceae bacterium]|jgi:hypothetical protein